jgi:opacity protein-like surface antigen
MNRCAKFVMAVLLCAVFTSPAVGQTPILVWAGAGPSLPLGDFGDAADTGWMGGAGILGVIGQSGLWIGAEASVGRNSFKDYDGGNWELMGGGGMVGYTLSPGARARPYVFGNAGMMSLKASVGGDSSESESGLSMGAGAGVTYTLSPSASLFASGRYLTFKIEEQRFNIVPITVGFTFAGSGGGDVRASTRR